MEGQDSMNSLLWSQALCCLLLSVWFVLPAGLVEKVCQQMLRQASTSTLHGHKQQEASLRYDLFDEICFSLGEQRSLWAKQFGSHHRGLATSSFNTHMSCLNESTSSLNKSNSSLVEMGADSFSRAFDKTANTQTVESRVLSPTSSALNVQKDGADKHLSMMQSESADCATQITAGKKLWYLNLTQNGSAFPRGSLSASWTEMMASSVTRNQSSFRKLSTTPRLMI